MKKPKVIMLSYYEHIRDLDDYVELHYHNWKKPDNDFYELVKDADLILEQEFNDGKAKYQRILSNVKTKKAVWLIDSHTRKDHKIYAHNFDHVFVAINRLRTLFDKPTEHMPLGCTFAKNCVKPSTLPKTLDVAFVGQFLNIGNRKQWLTKLNKDLIDLKKKVNFCTKYGQEYISIHQSAKVAFNKSIGNECNFRIFEVMAMGVPQVTDWNNECALVPGLKERCFWYEKYEEIIPQIEKVLLMPDKEISDFMTENQRWLLNGNMITDRHVSIIEKCLGYSLKKQTP